MAEPTHRYGHRATLVALAVAGTSATLQQTVVFPALPQIRVDLHTTTTLATWVLTGLLLVAVVATPVVGKLGDQFGKRRLMLISLAALFAGSILALLAWNIWVLILGRAIMGLGSGYFPLALATIKNEFPAHRVGTGIAVVSSTIPVGTGLGVVVAGPITDQLSWRWIFALTAAAFAISIELNRRFVAESSIKSPSRVDVKGAVLLSVGLVSLLLALTEGPHWGWASGRVLALFTGAAVVLSVFGGLEWRLPEPMLDLRMISRRPVLVTNLATAIGTFGIFGALVIIPLFIEAPRGLPRETAQLVTYGFGASVTVAGLYLLPSAITGFLGGPAASLISGRHGTKHAFVAGSLGAGAGLTGLALWHARAWQVVASTLVVGLCNPMWYAATGRLTVDSVGPTETGAAAGINHVMRLLGAMLGTQVLASILASDTIHGTSVPAEGAFTIAFACAAGTTLAAAGMGLLVTPSRRRAAALAADPAASLRAQRARR